MNILLADNTPLYRDILQQALGGDARVTITLVASIAEVLTAVQRQRFQFFIFAWQLEDGEGIALAKQLRETKSVPFEPIVLLTSSASADLAITASKSGVTEIFRKQDIDELVTFIRHFLQVYSPLPCRVIYVEDANDQRLALKAQMLEWGMQVDAFATADEAWQALQTTHYDLAVCDVVLGGQMTGSRFINRIRRQSGPTGKMLILAATAFDNPARRIELFHLGIDDYIVKPIVSLELKARIHNLLSRKQAIEQNQQLLQATQLGVVLIDDIGTIASLDGNASAMFGHSDSEARGQSISLLIDGDPQVSELEGLSHAPRRAFRKGSVPFPAEITSLRLTTGDGISRIALLFRDVSAEADLAKHLTQAKEAAEHAGMMKSQFLSNMSHEIRTPLNAIVGMAHLIRRAGISPEQADRLSKIDSAGQHLLNVINSVLDLSKIEAGKFTLEQTRVSIGAICANVASILTSAAQAKNLKLRVETEPLAHPVLGDPVRLQQALLNYASNAVKFTDSGQITVRATTECELADSIKIRFEVEDTGIGISPKDVQRLFGAFEQADTSTSRKYGGTGLGLAITQKLAALMEGGAGVSSNPGGGSTFWFTACLRKADGVLDTTPVITATPAEQLLKSRYGNKRILLAEDEPINREVTLALLEDVHQAVDVAEDGLQALELARRNHYDLILMDMQMPHMDGLEATRQIRQLANQAGTPILAMTANAFTEDKQKCMDAGMNDFITKPVDPELMFSVLVKWLSTTHPDASTTTRH